MISCRNRRWRVGCERGLRGEAHAFIAQVAPRILAQLRTSSAEFDTEPTTTSLWTLGAAPERHPGRPPPCKRQREEKGTSCLCQALCRCPHARVDNKPSSQNLSWPAGLKCERMHLPSRLRRKLPKVSPTPSVLISASHSPGAVGARAPVKVCSPLASQSDVLFYLFGRTSANFL